MPSSQITLFILLPLTNEENKFYEFAALISYVGSHDEPQSGGRLPPAGCCGHRSEWAAKKLYDSSCW